MELDRQAIERRDFPIARRGYDTASVDAHLRALAAEVQELRRQASGAGRGSLAAAAGAQVQGILEAAQTSAQEIEREATEQAERVRADADAAAQATREQAIATARERVAAVAEATEALLRRVGSLDGEARALVKGLRGGAGRLAGDLESLNVEMAGLYDAATGRTSAGEPIELPPASTEDTPTQASAEAAPSESAAPAESVVPAESAASPESDAAENGSDAPMRFADPQQVGQPAGAPAGDLDGARLVALNMALNGDSRQATGRYLAENFDVPDPEKLLDEVYAAIEA